MGAVGIVPVIGSVISGIFTHHKQAVKNEAAVLNAAVPKFVSALQTIAAYVSQGATTKESALAAIDQATSQYDSMVSSITKECNGPCTVRKSYIVPWGDQLKEIINAGSGSFSGSAGSHAGFMGANFTINVKPLQSSGNLGNNVATNTNTSPQVAQTLAVPGATPTVTAPVSEASMLPFNLNLENSTSKWVIAGVLLTTVAVVFSMMDHGRRHRREY